MMTPIEIINRKTMLGDQIATAVSEERIEDARRLEGQVIMLEEMLRDAMEAEEEIRARAEASGTLITAMPAGRVERFLGTRAEFSGLKVGDRIGIDIRDDAGDPDITPVSMPNRTWEDTTFPIWGDSPYVNFVSTINHSDTDGDVKYMRRKTRSINFATWEPGDLKETSLLEWEPATAPMETIASIIPIEEPTLRRYGELKSIITNELSIGLRDAVDLRALQGSNAQGITGILNTVGIQTYTQLQGDTIIDSLRRMITRAVMGSRLYPDHIAVAPQVKEAIDLLKDDEGRYLTIMLNGRVWSLPVIEDINLVTATTATVDESEVTTMHFGAMVYFSAAATLFSGGLQYLDVGTVNDQFARNQLMLRLEEDDALKVTYPDAFVYCSDAIASQVVA